MKLKSNIIDPYVGQEAEGKKIKFESVDKIEFDFHQLNLMFYLYIE